MAAPVLLKDVAQVEIGNEPRLGIAGYGQEDDIVEGVVLMQRGAKSMPTITAVKQQLEDINASGILPPGVHLERIYDRSDLINHTTSTVIENMVVGIILIFVLQWAFLGNLRSAIIVAITIPFALSFAVLIIVLQGNPPTCCRWARWTSVWWSMPRSSWWRTSSAIWSSDPSM
jgi:cobalt-zinc-cadmium resistance protein CzcA